MKDRHTGFLVPPKDAQAMAARIELLLSDDRMRYELAKNSIEDARQRFDLKYQVDDYLGYKNEF